MFDKPTISLKIVYNFIKNSLLFIKIIKIFENKKYLITNCNVTTMSLIPNIIYLLNI